MSTAASMLLEGGNVMSSGSAQHGGIQMFCLQEHCIFGWMSQKWVVKILLFGLWIGVICIAGFNYAVQFFFCSLQLILCTDFLCPYDVSYCRCSISLR